MTIYEFDQKQYDEDLREEGREEGEGNLGELICVLINSGRNDDILKVASDSKYRNELFKEFKIK